MPVGIDIPLRDDRLAACSFFGGDDFVQVVNSIASNRNSFIKSTVSSGWFGERRRKVPPSFWKHFLRSREDEHKLFLLKRPNEKFANSLKCKTLLPQADDREQCLRTPAMMLFVPESF